MYSLWIINITALFYHRVYLHIKTAKCRPGQCTLRDETNKNSFRIFAKIYFIFAKMVTKKPNLRKCHCTFMYRYRYRYLVSLSIKMSSHSTSKCINMLLFPNIMYSYYRSIMFFFLSTFSRKNSYSTKTGEDSNDSICVLLYCFWYFWAWKKL